MAHVHLWGEYMKKTSYHWLVLICCCGLITITFGLNNITGLFFTSIAADLGCGIGQASMFLSVVNIVSGFAGPYCAMLRKKVNLRLTMLAGLILAICCYVGVYFAHSIYLLYFYAAVIGICNGLYGSTLVVELINNWFEKMNSTAVGIAMAFSGVAGAVLSPIMTSLIANKGWRISYLMAFSLLVIIFLVPSLFILRSTPKELGMSRFGEEEKGIIDDQAKEKQKVKVFCPEMLLIALFPVVGACITSIGAHMAVYASTIGLTEAKGAVLVSTIMCGNLSSKVLLGLISDRFGPKISVFLTFVLTIGGLVILLLVPSSIFILLIAGAFIMGFSYAAGNVIAQGLCQIMFGKEQSADYFAWLNVPILCVSALNTSLIGFVYDACGSYKPSIIVLGSLFILSYILVLAAYKRKRA